MSPASRGSTLRIPRRGRPLAAAPALPERRSDAHRHPGRRLAHTAVRSSRRTHPNLTADQIVDKGQDTYLALGDHLLLLPPRLAGLLRGLADEPPPRLTIPHGLSGPSWLFPGRVSGQPIANSALSKRLNRYGITIRTARNGALAALAEDLPAAVLADLLDIHLNTAIRWVKHAKRDWADYLAARAAEQAEKAL